MYNKITSLDCCFLPRLLLFLGLLLPYILPLQHPHPDRWEGGLDPMTLLSLEMLYWKMGLKPDAEVVLLQNRLNKNANI